MLHTRVVDCSLALLVRQFEPKCSNCVGRMHNGLCTGCPTPEFYASSKIGRENIRHSWTGEWSRE